MLMTEPCPNLVHESRRNDPCPHGCNFEPPTETNARNKHAAPNAPYWWSRNPLSASRRCPENSYELPRTDQTKSGHRLSGKGGQGSHGTSKGGQGLANESHGWPRAPKGGQGKPNQQPKGTKDCLRNAMWTPSGARIHIPGQNLRVSQPTTPAGHTIEF